MSEHPSFFALELHALQGDAAIDKHVASCGECQAHLSRLALPRPTPTWVTDVARPKRMRWMWWLPAGALAGILGIAVLTQPTTTAKALPSVGVYVKHGGRVTLWNGRAAVQPGDALRLHITASGFNFVTVCTSDSSGPRVLYSGRIEQSLLPVSFAVDQDGKQEQLWVVFSNEALRPDLLARAMFTEVTGTWTTRLSIPKESL